MLILNSEQTEDRLPYEALCGSIATVIDERREGLVEMPSRLFVPVTGGSLIVMPAAGPRLAIIKTVTLHAGNPSEGLPTIQGEVLVMQAGDGRRLGILDGGVVTARRTAAVSAFAARKLAGGAGDLLIVGAGTQGRSHLEAFCQLLPIQQVYVCSRRRESAEELVSAARRKGIEAHCVNAPGDVANRVLYIVTATTSAEPVLEGPLIPRAFMAAVGAYRADMAEIDSGLVRGASLYVDTLEGARKEAGDLIRADVDWDTVGELADLVESPQELDTDRPILFKSVGSALWDLAAARCAFPD